MPRERVRHTECVCVCIYIYIYVCMPNLFSWTYVKILGRWICNHFVLLTLRPALTLNSYPANVEYRVSS
jgi:hypothetical protein